MDVGLSQHRDKSVEWLAGLIVFEAFLSAIKQIHLHSNKISQIQDLK